MVDLMKSEGNGFRFEGLLRTILDAKQSVAPVQRKQRILSRPTLDELFKEIDKYNLAKETR